MHFHTPKRSLDCAASFGDCWWVRRILTDVFALFCFFLPRGVHAELLPQNRDARPDLSQDGPSRLGLKTGVWWCRALSVAYFCCFVFSLKEGVQHPAFWHGDTVICARRRRLVVLENMEEPSVVCVLGVGLPESVGCTQHSSCSVKP